MNIRHLATKSFDGGTEERKYLIYNGIPLCIQLANLNERDAKEVPLEFNKDYPDKINMSQDLNKGKDEILESPISSIVLGKNNDIRPLSQIYDFKVDSSSPLSEFLPSGATFDSIIESDDMKSYMRQVAVDMFKNENPNTGDSDINKDAFYTPYIPLVVLTGAMTPQLDSLSNTLFNPEGTVTIAEFLDSLNAIKFGCNSNLRRKKSMDNISDESDYFNEGYQRCIRGISSPFYNLYTREELLRPITRCELAYLTVICWDSFIEKYNNIYGSVYYLGINFDWENPSEYISKFEDGFDYNASKIILDEEHDVISLNIKDYKSDRTMDEFLEDIKLGVSPIPLPMFMSMVELDILGLFHYSDLRLDAIKQVSRGELCYFITMLAKLFPAKYID